MIRTAFLLAAGFFAFDSLLPPLSNAQSQPLSSMKWEKRPLFIFAPDSGQADNQWSILQKNMDGLKDRDMMVLTVTDRVTARLGRAPADVSAADLRDHYNVPRQRYESILVGKDGTRKALWRDPVEAEAIFRIIDAMPMRQREMTDG
ncbi:DUF4174 domain-containing protein [Notoacmeibacter sp. MSK16QG-6]|uniref:DUF4174 domain-containing protein n=1 Tax=Notoacmeibacter sp. MSK16QG-6 TaxID=2957982 RepID=UPI00209F8533|nr:DUF4174 domain-containing protein [Notoacmeibacter sp. MSK16QG-6]MCP1199142.1 DUF4174 domain-containing protein [Notoacmeibacter sp. MSK16QG-6]